MSIRPHIKVNRQVLKFIIMLFLHMMYRGKGKKGRKRVLALSLAASIVLSGCSAMDLPWNREKAKRQQQSFDEMAEELFVDSITSDLLSLHFYLADPEAYGIEDYELTIGSYRLEDMQESTEEIQQVKEELEKVDYDFLTKEQQMTYEVLDFYLDTELEYEGLELYANPVSPTIGQQVELPLMFADYIFYDKQDVEEYLEVFSQIDTYYEEIVEFERFKSEEGLFMSDATADAVIESCQGYLEAPEKSFLTKTFSEKLDGLTGVTEEEKKTYEARHLEIMKEDFVPAYETLIAGIEELKGTGVNDLGLYYYPEGQEYYKYLLCARTGVTYKNMAWLEREILKRINMELGQLREIISENEDLINQAENYEFALSEPNEILDDLQEQIQGSFPEISSMTYNLKYVPESLEEAFSPAACLAPPIDRPEDNMIYINGGEEYEDYDLYTVLAHEGYPGHLYQNVYFQESGVSNLRSLLKYTGYSEGWATYVEHLAYEYDNGLDPELAKLLSYNSSINMGVSALLDLYIHYYGWDQETTGQYLEETMGIDNPEMVEEFYQAIIENPVNYMKYYLGYLKIADMRMEAEEQLGDRFDAKKFHKFLLDMGPAPFSIIEEYFEEDYLKTE